MCADFDHSITRTACIVFAASLMCIGTAAAQEPILQHPDDPDIEWNPCPEFFPEGCGMAVLQGDPEGRNADVLLRVPGNSEVAHHWHTSAERMVLVQGEFVIDNDGHEPVTMRAGSYAYGPARLPHTAACRSDEDCLLFIAFEEPVDAVPTGE
jgi:mannose-6-phosphate isomerase-like protein (cupin superfamily)